jgi:hypothetical protein
MHHGAVQINDVREALRRNRVGAAVARRAGGQLVAFGEDAGLSTALSALGVEFRTSLVPADDPPREPLPADLDRRLTTRPVELLYRRATRALTNSAPRRVAGGSFVKRPAVASL